LKSESVTPLLSPIVGHFRLDDESLRRRAEIRKRVTGDERQGSAGRRLQDRRVVRFDDAGVSDHVTKNRVAGRNCDAIASARVSEPTEEGVSMAGEAAVSGFTWKSGLRDVADRASQC
jgi:hypothetical protein